jgi:hypothetical protein
MSESEKLHASNNLIMKAIIICDDFAFVAQANAALQRVGCRPNIGAQWNIKSWPVNSLKQAVMAEKVLVEAADAHLIVIPARRAHSLPLWLRDWLERWAALRQIQDAALAVIDDGVDARFTKTMNPELTAFAQKNGLNFLTDEVAVGKDAAKLFVRLWCGPDLPPSAERSHPEERDPFRRMGINE